MGPLKSYKRFTKQGKFNKPVHWVYKEWVKRHQKEDKETLTDIFFSRFRHFPLMNRHNKARMDLYAPIIKKNGLENLHQLSVIIIEIELGMDFQKDLDLANHAHFIAERELEKLGYGKASV